jgi:uncharacterized protein with NRDE domain
MCLIAFAWRAHPDYRLLLAANRDEFHARPAASLRWWEDRPSILAGRDLCAGGTWLAIGDTGRFATVTNYRETLQVQPAERSRGELVAGFVASGESPLEFMQGIDGDRYAGFSLLAGTPESMACVSNRGDAARPLEPGLYGLSNASLDTPWPKVRRSKARLEKLLAKETVDFDALFELLADREPATVGQAEAEGVPPELARAVSAPFIVTPEFGTRCSTVLSVATSGEVRIVERRYDSAGWPVGESHFEFRIR